KHSLAIACDLTNKAEVEHALNLVASTYGGIDIVISNAGAAWQGEMAELPDDVLRRSFELNFFAHQDVAQAAVRHFRLQDFGSSPGSNLGGQLLFNVSKQALNPGKSFGAYGTAKSALLALMKQYALEEGANGIRANAINADRIRSGLLTTDMISDRAEARGLSEAQYMSGNLLGVEVTAEDVADAFASLALMKSTTGAVLTVDGGNVAAMVR
ncbi:MAG: SDR family oxidoreductase, partial [Prochlorococcus sp.]